MAVVLYSSDVLAKPKLAFNCCTRMYNSWRWFKCLPTLLILRSIFYSSDAFTPLLKKCTKFYFLKMQQLNKIWILETVAFVREKRTHQYASFRKKTWRLIHPPRTAVVRAEAIFWLCQNSLSTDGQGCSSVDEGVIVDAHLIPMKFRTEGKQSLKIF